MNENTKTEKLNEEIHKPECFGRYTFECDRYCNGHHLGNCCDFEFNRECKEATDCLGNHLEDDEKDICVICCSKDSCAEWYGDQVPIACSLWILKTSKDKARQQGIEIGEKQKFINSKSYTETYKQGIEQGKKDGWKEAEDGIKQVKEVHKIEIRQAKRDERERIIEYLGTCIGESDGMDETWRKGAIWLLSELKNPTEKGD